MNSKESRIKSSSYNLIASVTLQIVTLLLEFFTQTVFIYRLGETYLGINGLFKNILGFLAISELGIGQAITFHMYKPAAEGNKEKIRSLLLLYKKCYRLVGAAILVLGSFVALFLPNLINFDSNVSMNYYSIYFLFLLDAVLSYYLFSYCTSIFTAFQKMHKVAVIQMVVKLFTGIFAIGLVWKYGSFYAYLCLRILSTIITNIIIGSMAKRDYCDFFYTKGVIVRREDIKIVFRNVYAIFVFTLGSKLLGATDNVIISLICGTSVVGYYSNYSLIVTAVSGLYSKAVKAIEPSVGNLNAIDDKETQLDTLKKLHFMNFWVVSFCSICLMVGLKPFVQLWTLRSGNANYLLPETVSIVSGVNFWLTWYLQFIDQFRMTKGLFRYGMYSQFASGIINIVLSFAFGKMWGLFGILFATTISIVVVAFPLLPYYLFRYGFNLSVRPFYIKMCKDFGLFVITFFITRFVVTGIERVFPLCVAIITCLIVPNIFFYYIHRNTEELHFFLSILRRLRNNIR